MPEPERLIDAVNGHALDYRTVKKTPALNIVAVKPGASALQVQRVLAAILPLAAAAIYFVYGQPLWALLGLGAFTLLGIFLPSWRPVLGFSRVVLLFGLFTFLINNFGIAYPYTNIFVLTGLLGVFALTGMEWKGLFFNAGKTAQYARAALLLAVGIAALIAAVFFAKPDLLGANPTPKAWPADVVIVMALGYAIFSALMEETIFRSLMIAFARQHMSMNVAVVAQAVVFGAMHYRVGFPTKAAGAALAFVWGLGAGWLVRKSDSVYPAYVMHFVLVLILFLVMAFVPSQ
ncbi:CPBP family intramembrane metalloprotease [candidate division KSB1 bacterium]|nr:CPBP family intramembrane metalloprotease [candidate division KSB1 bacterium]